MYIHHYIVFERLGGGYCNVSAHENKDPRAVLGILSKAATVTVRQHQGRMSGIFGDSGIPRQVDRFPMIIHSRTDGQHPPLFFWGGGFEKTTKDKQNRRGNDTRKLVVRVSDSDRR
ncbi:hypothetical protein FJTKL_07860 [Diaporthe vaccinii]|uniref:Uncharacterized protein n=1 Tax=Diaporthe vaccinii TaxID=105482 RepID=A0ABR4FE27_9PEZI